MKIEAGVMSFCFSNDCSLIFKTERRHSDHPCQRKMRHLQFSRLGLTHVCACLLNVTHSHSHLISYWCLVRTQLRDTHGASLFNWLVLQNRRIELAGSGTTFFFQFFFHFLFPKIQQEKEKKTCQLCHVDSVTSSPPYQNESSHFPDILERTFSCNEDIQRDICLKSVANVFNMIYKRKQKFNPQIMSHAHVGYWEKFKAVSFKNKTQMHVYTVLHCN